MNLLIAKFNIVELIGVLLRTKYTCLKIKSNDYAFIIGSTGKHKHYFFKQITSFLEMTTLVI
jgi:hypothetical protein